MPTRLLSPSLSHSSVLWSCSSSAFSSCLLPSSPDIYTKGERESPFYWGGWMSNEEKEKLFPFIPAHEHEPLKLLAGLLLVQFSWVQSIIQVKWLLIPLLSMSPLRLHPNCLRRDTESGSGNKVNSFIFLWMNANVIIVIILYVYKYTSTSLLYAT